MIGIYKITNTVNGKIYIGQSTNIETRWKQHKQHLRNNYHCNEHLQRAWNRYGENAFVFEVIAECTEDKLNELEAKFIEEYHGTDFKYGYNEKTGGDHEKLTEAMKQKLRKPKPPRTKEHCMKLGAAHIGKSPWNKGLTTPPEVRAKQSARKVGKKPYNCKSVICVTTGEIFPDTVTAAERYGLIATNIRKCCRGERKSVGKKEWRYLA